MTQEGSIEAGGKIGTDTPTLQGENGRNQTKITPTSLKTKFLIPSDFFTFLYKNQELN